MSVTTRIRSIVILAAALLVAPALLADFPASRIESRMVFDPTIGQAVMFGGQTPVDRATNRTYELAETWLWNGARWTQVYAPLNLATPDPNDFVPWPSGRASHVFVWDSIRNRGVMFGGEQVVVENGQNNVNQLDDTWIWQNNNWHQLAPPASPGRRKLAGAAFDRARDRVVLYGGHRLSDDRKKLENLRDTWEFDGTTWTRVAENGPELSKPILEYDPIRNETIMLGFTTAGATQMYRFNAQTHVWTRIEHSTIPVCVNEATLNWNPDRERIVFTGGFCAGMVPGALAEVLEWNGESWTAQNSLTAPARIFGHAAAYDPIRENLVTFAGTTSSGTSNVSTYVLEGGRNWRFIFDSQTPAPRSLAAADTDPDTGVVWLYSGVVDPGSGSTDLWRYANGDWQQVIIDGTPDTCSSALAAYDTDRKRFVVTCSSGFVYELDTAALTWARFDTLKEVPPGRSYASIAYDPTIKRTVLYGGFNGVNYLNDTWLWDGTKWTEVERNPAPGRSLAAMWYDPTLKKVIVYGGIGRPNNESRITRYSDMYSLDSNQGWTKLTPATTPGARYGAQVTVDPRTNKVLVFGGILYQEDAGGANARQSYANDMWEWNGTAWTQRTLTVPPPARENGVFEYDPSTRRLMMFGGYAGTFYSDTWLEDATGLIWTVQNERVIRRRPARR